MSFFLAFFAVLTLPRLPSAFPFALPWSSEASIYGLNGRAITPDPPEGHWVDTWTSMPQLTEFSNLPPAPFVCISIVNPCHTDSSPQNKSSLVFPNSTIRQTLHVTTPAQQIRIHVSNAFGLVELPVTAMTIALPIAEAGQNQTGASGVNATTLQTVSFSGNRSISVAAGALAVSDPLNFPVKANQVISISMYLKDGQASQYITSHPGSRTTSWISFGDYTQAKNLTDTSTTSIEHWYFLSAIEAWQPQDYHNFVILGDSITDGRGSYVNANLRWTDLLYNRIAGRLPLSVSNQAAGGNRVLRDGLGPSLLSRIERDVLSHQSVKYAMIFESVNDIGDADATIANQTVTGNRLIQAYQQIITKIHAFNVPVFGATITPFGCANATLQPYSDPVREQTQLKVNEWIRSNIGETGGFDGLVDFDAVMRDPKNQTRLRPDFDSGDCLHPNVEGYRDMADAFPLELFEKFENGVEGFM